MVESMHLTEVKVEDFRFLSKLGFHFYIIAAPGDDGGQDKE